MNDVDSSCAHGAVELAQANRAKGLYAGFLEQHLHEDPVKMTDAQAGDTQRIPKITASGTARIALPPDHPQRALLADEIHARPTEALLPPTRVTHIAILVNTGSREMERAHLSALCSRSGAVGPAPGSSYLSAQLGSVRLKWEAHGEFSGYTLFTPGESAQPFLEHPALEVPQSWLAAIPGEVIFAGHAQVLPSANLAPDAETLAKYFDRNIVVGSEVGGGAGAVFTDFRRDENGFGRFLLLDRQLTPRQAGRVVGRLFEIETYRMMALLALPLARQYAAEAVKIEQALTELTARIAADNSTDEPLLQELTRLAAEVEQSLAATQFRFGACRAYQALVTTRIAELRERRLPGLQTVEEFMTRRFNPAVATCMSTSERLQKLAERVAQASALLSTRVSIVRERQNQQLLESMNLRAERQLHLQQAVEWLSVAAISYYVTSLLADGAKALQAAGVRLNVEIAVGMTIPLIVIAVIWVVRRAHTTIGAN